ncbi:MAG TPA: OmpA family protein [Bacteroidia bacterium]|nr:OmpA family protein [Bacteroidia bacterium]
MRFPKLIICLLTLSLATSACVSKKKYGEMEALKNKMQDMADSRNKSLNQLKSDVADLQMKLNQCEEERTQLANDTTRLGGGYRKMREDIGDMRAKNEQLSTNYQKLKAQGTEKMRDLVDQMEGLQRDLNERDKKIAFMEGVLNERESRLADVENKLHQRDSLMNAIQKRVTDALLGFQDQGLTVEVIDGKVYVSLSNKLLFATGSTKIDANGQKALAGLANALKEQKDVTIMVEGHTDNMPVSNLGDIKDNWDLSVMRSTEVVRILVLNGMEPTRILPAGRGQYVPKVEGTTPEARANNRRTEIVISPKLDELYQLINQQR